jgi:hypothetical protein
MLEHKPATGLMSDPDLRGMIEVWFALEKMKSNLIVEPGFARMLKRCEERTHAAIMHLASETVTERIVPADQNEGAEAVRVLRKEAVGRARTETAAALAELRHCMTDIISSAP